MYVHDTQIKKEIIIKTIFCNIFRGLRKKKSLQFFTILSDCTLFLKLVDALPLCKTTLPHIFYNTT